MNPVLKRPYKMLLFFDIQWEFVGFFDEQVFIYFRSLFFKRLCLKFSGCPWPLHRYGRIFSN